VTPGGHTRYTLRLPRAAAAPAAAVAAAPDDWSGQAAFALSPEPLDYAHPDAVSLVASLQPDGWQEEDGGDTLVFWLDDETATRAADALARLGALGRLESEPQRPGWEDAWKEFHQPVTVGRLRVRPPWCPAEPGLLDVIVDAGQAFGTGGHATTRQCLKEIQEIGGGSLMDVGCGSGVVSLAALRLGFAPVWGVDVDPAAVRAAKENARRNGLAPAFSVGDATDPALPLPRAQTVVANLALAPILRIAPRFAAAGAAAPAGLGPAHVLLAGLLAGQADEAAAAFPGYREVRRRSDGEWAVVHLAAAR
jgi:ribosomal protein L11 methyltransferase